MTTLPTVNKDIFFFVIHLLGNGSVVKSRAFYSFQDCRDRGLAYLEPEEQLIIFKLEGTDVLKNTTPLNPWNWFPVVGEELSDIRDYFCMISPNAYDRFTLESQQKQSKEAR